MDSNVFGGVSKKIEDGLTIEQLIKLNLLQKPTEKKVSGSK